MRKQTKYTNEPIRAEVVDDFLPPPEELVRREDTVKVTISLTKPTVDFFKEHARLSRTQYQKMIRRVLDLYASHHQ